MKKTFLVCILFIFSILSTNAQSREIYMIGPMIHFNIGEPQFNISFGLECSYWNWEHFPYSIDGGIEIGGKKLRIYTEGQTGIGVLGASLGPVLQYNFAESKLNLGTQGSLWANYFAGVDLRFRFIDNKSIFSPGIYAKIPISSGYSSNNTDENHHDWDWD